jgi:hypothetical protein
MTPEISEFDLEAARAELFRKKLLEMEQEAVDELTALHHELKRRQYAEDPVLWAKERLGDMLWSAQQQIINAVRDHRRVAVMSAHEIGKALALDTPLPTPTGWTTMRDVQVGDELLNEVGESCKVTAVSPIHVRPCFKFIFDDRSEIIASDNHEWNVLNLNTRMRTIKQSSFEVDWRDHWNKAETKTSEDLIPLIRKTWKSGGSQNNLSVPCCQPILSADETTPYPIAPYVLGAWLGDGTSTQGAITCGTDDGVEILAAINASGTQTRVRPASQKENHASHGLLQTHALLRELNLLDNKHIPSQILRADIGTRLLVLQGLMDTDGYCMTGAGVGICLTNKRLADDAAELIRTFGWKTFRRERPAMLEGRECGTRYSIDFRSNLPVFRLNRKLSQMEEARTSVFASKHTHRMIDSIESVEEREVKCVVVDSPRHLFLAGESFIPTHNSYIAAITSAWWLDINVPGDAFVVTSAPSAPQVKAILWREINRVHARGGLPGRTNQTEWYMPSALGKEELVAFGRKPDEYNPTAFQGIHARRVLIIFDEANGIRGPLHEAADSLIANDRGKALYISNPDDPSGEFYDACKPGSGWHVISVSAFDSPNFTGEPLPVRILESLIGKVYVEEKRKKWAPKWTWSDDGKRVFPPDGESEENTNPMWQSKVLGIFPKITGTGGLIPLSWIKSAQTRELKAVGKKELGVDVGGGSDESTVCLRHGPVYRIIRADRDPDTMAQCGKIVNDMQETGASLVKIDKIGIGWGIVNRGQELKLPFVGINVSEEPSDEEESSDERFANLKAELWWNVRTLFERGEIDIDPFDDDLAAELCTVRYERRSTGKIQILNKKKDANGKTISSPNRAESLMLASATPPVRGGEASYVW